MLLLVVVVLAGHTATLRDYVDLFDSASQQIQNNATRYKLDDGSYEWRHTRLTGQSATNLVMIISLS